jgi:hypothetical protein
MRSFQPRSHILPYLLHLRLARTHALLLPENQLLAFPLLTSTNFRVVLHVVRTPNTGTG